MSEAGWRGFLIADGVEDWVVLHGGAAAAFRVGSLVEAARLAAAIADVPGLAGTSVKLTVGDGLLSVRLTREMWGLEARHVELARAVSAMARAHGAVADRSAVQEVQLAVSAKPDALDVGFWRAVLGYAEMAPDNGGDPLGHSSTVWMQELDPDKPLRHAMHVDVSLAREAARTRLDAALAAGGRIVQDDDAPGTWILSDRAGNRVCIASWPDGAATRESAGIAGGEGATE
jgi:4a-hydroxytetrahydrobiopterin dehydratase